MSILSLNDDILGGMSWGDFQCEVDKLAQRDEAQRDHAQRDDLNLEYPVLSLRKDIWTHFPVTLVPLGTGSDGAERHAVVWHRKHLVEWRETKSADFQEWMDYEAITEYRLMKCLRASARWVVEPAQQEHQICIIRMLYGNQAPVRCVMAEPVRSNIPVLTRLNDIKLYFPVVWHSVSSLSSDSKIYALELYEKRIKELSVEAGYNVRDEILEKLTKALRASTSWRVLRSQERKEVCRLEIAT